MKNLFATLVLLFGVLMANAQVSAKHVNAGHRYTRWKTYRIDGTRRT